MKMSENVYGKSIEPTNKPIFCHSSVKEILFAFIQ